MQYVLSQHGPPSVAIVPAIEHYQSHYSISIHASATKAYILLILPQDKTANVYVDGAVSSSSIKLYIYS